MSKPFNLQVILDLAQSEADRSAARLGALTSHLQSLENQLALLTQYRDEYLARFRERMEIEPAAGRDNFHQFMDKLDAAITQQRASVEQARLQMQSGRDEHLDRRRRVKAFTTLSQRQAGMEQLRARRSEQRAVDERNSNGAFRKAKIA